METILHVLALLLVSVAIALSLAHALELPGKKRLDKDTYIACQEIYYPGFAAGGLVGDVGGTLALAVLLFFLPYGTASFWWSAVALACLIAVNGIYWVFTHPVNRFWLKDVKPSGAATSFFSSFAHRGDEENWKRLRNIWEYSHVVRAVFAILGLVSTTIALIA